MDKHNSPCVTFYDEKYFFEEKSSDGYTVYSEHLSI